MLAQANRCVNTGKGALLRAEEGKRKWHVRKTINKRATEENGKWHVRKTINKRATEEKWQMARKEND